MSKTATCHIPKFQTCSTALTSLAVCGNSPLSSPTKMKNSAAALPLLLLLAVFLLLPQPSAGTPFICAAAPRATCQSLIGYIPANATTYAAVKSLFGVKSIRSLFSANALSSSTRSSAPIPAGSLVRVPIPCACSAGSGSSSDRPIYVVKAGDGLDSIARNNFDAFVTYQEIAAANNISDPNKIDVGQRLLIPLPCSCDAVDGSPAVHYAHLVVPGSSVASIAKEFGVSQTALLRINGIKDPKTLEAGQVLDVPLKACSSSISNTSIDRNLLVPNGSYALTAKNCVSCSCSSTTWQLDCRPAQGISKNTCPATKCGSLSIGNTSSISACKTTTCTYAGYTASNILTSLTNQSSCNGTSGLGPEPSQNTGSASSLQIKWRNGTVLLIFHIVLVLFGFLWHEK